MSAENDTIQYCLKRFFILFYFFEMRKYESRFQTLDPLENMHEHD